MRRNTNQPFCHSTPCAKEPSGKLTDLTLLDCPARVFRGPGRVIVGAMACLFRSLQSRVRALLMVHSAVRIRPGAPIINSLRRTDEKLSPIDLNFSHWSATNLGELRKARLLKRLNHVGFASVDLLRNARVGVT